MSADRQVNAGSQVNTKQLVLGGVLVGVSAIIGAAGLAICVAAVAGVLRDRYSSYKEPANAAMRNTLAHARAATKAGVQAWQSDTVPEPQRTR